MKQIGIALGADRLRAALPGGRSFETTDVADFARALIDLKKDSNLAVAAVTVAVLPPLVEVRRIPLPTLRPDEHRRVIARDVARYFVGARDPQVIGSDPPFAAAISAHLITSIESAVKQVGWRLRAVVPAQVAWAARARDGQIVARAHNFAELLELRGGKVVQRTRLRAGDTVTTATVIDPFVIAAEQAPLLAENALQLLTDAHRAIRRQRARRLAGFLTAAAGLCLLISAALDWWGLSRELATLRERRVAIAGDVARAMQWRDSLARVEGVLASLRSLEEASPRWTLFFADLAAYLPREAHLVAFRTVGDSVAMVGVAPEAASVFQGLERMPRLSAVSADGAIRQVVTATGIVREHFGVSARWTPQ
jgi:hypothetical protein